MCRSESRLHAGRCRTVSPDLHGGSRSTILVNTAAQAQALMDRTQMAMQEPERLHTEHPRCRLTLTGADLRTAVETERTWIPASGSTATGQVSSSGSQFFHLHSGDDGHSCPFPTWWNSCEARCPDSPGAETQEPATPGRSSL